MNEKSSSDSRQPRIKTLSSDAKLRDTAFGRDKTVRVKTAKGRKLSSTRWLQRQLNDPYVIAAKNEGYRSRAAYKLLDLDKQFHFLKNGQTIIDLGAAPGGWSQICADRVDSVTGKGRVVAMDIQDMPTIPGVIFLHKDFTDDDASDQLMQAAEGKVDAVISDMAPFTIGVKSADQLRIVYLVDLAAHFAIKVLKKNGIFIVKMFESGVQEDLSLLLKKNFTTVKNFKPKSSRADSSEIFVVAQGFLGQQV